MAIGQAPFDPGIDRCSDLVGIEVLVEVMEVVGIDLEIAIARAEAMVKLEAAGWMGDAIPAAVQDEQGCVDAMGICLQALDGGEKFCGKAGGALVMAERIAQVTLESFGGAKATAAVDTGFEGELRPNFGEQVAER